MNNTTNSWEERFDELELFARADGSTITMDISAIDTIKDFIRTLLHDTEIVAREDEKNGCAKEWQEAYDEGKKIAREEIKKEIDLAITQIHGGGNGRRLLEQLRDALSH
jgi:ribosomal protein L18